MHRGRGYLSVGVDKNEEVADGFFRPRVPSGGNLPAVEFDDASAVLCRDFLGPIRRGIASNDHFMRLGKFLAGFGDRGQRPSQQLFLIVGWDDEGDHARATRSPGTSSLRLGRSFFSS